MEKRKYIHNLKNVKLVIGNGFDLHCGLKTSYKDYFKSREPDIKFFENEFDIFYKHILSLKNTNRALYLVQSSLFSNKAMKERGIWDVFFYLSSYKFENDEIRWCDIETEMINALMHKNDANISFEKIYEIIDRMGFESCVFDSFDDNDLGNALLAAFIFNANSRTKFKDKTMFYSFLLSQLKIFEKNFGQFIHHKRIPNSNFLSKNDIYDKNAAKTIDELVNPKELMSIDSFNFDELGDKFMSITRNINGTIDNPIFGIDSVVVEQSDPRYIFTKTARRMELDAILNDIGRIAEFNNAIVYGHSLSENDYSYFFPLLDKLEITDFSSNKSIIFAFSVYDETRKEIIRTEYLQSIRKMFRKYAEFKGYDKEYSRLLDSLTSQGRVLMYEIPNLL